MAEGLVIIYKKLFYHTIYKKSLPQILERRCEQMENYENIIRVNNWQHIHKIMHDKK
jgi:hypothetical protein